jgi:hypothetical protein
MQKNVGGIDRILRIVLGLGLIALAATSVIPAWGYVGVVPLLTAVIGYCPAYSLFGIKTCPAAKNA